MQFIYKNFTILLILNSFLFIACAPDSKYIGGKGSLRNYESINAYENQAIKYNQNYNKQTQSSFSSTLVANDRDNIKQTPQNTRNNPTYNNNKQQVSIIYKKQDPTAKNGNYEPPVTGNGSFEPTQSLLGGMRDSEAIQRATMKPYNVRGKTYRPHPVKVGDSFDGIASWYGPDFHARATSNGETYNMYAHTAAHKTLPMNTIVKVFNKDNGKITYVRINDRGPFVDGRIIDLSNVAARDIQMIGKGVANVRIEVVGFGGTLKNNTQIKDSNNIKNNKNSNITSNKVKENNINNNQYNKNTYTTLKRNNSNINTNNEIITRNNPNENTITNDKKYNDNSNRILKNNNDNTNETLYNESKSQQTTIVNYPNNIETTKTNTNQHKENAVKSINNSNTFDTIEEDLPIEQKDKKIDKDKNISNKNYKIQEYNEEYMEVKIPPNIDNNKSIEDINQSLQKLKDSTNNLSNKTQNKIDEINVDKNKEEANTQDKNPLKTDKKLLDNKQNVANFMVSLNVFSNMERAQHFKEESIKIVENTQYTLDIVSMPKNLYRVAIRGFITHDEAKEFITNNNIVGHVVEENK